MAVQADFTISFGRFQLATLALAFALAANAFRYSLVDTRIGTMGEDGALIDLDEDLGELSWACAPFA
jgi:hypothetical protein